MSAALDTLATPLRPGLQLRRVAIRAARVAIGAAPIALLVAAAWVERAAPGTAVFCLAVGFVLAGGLAPVQLLLAPTLRPAELEVLKTSAKADVVLALARGPEGRQEFHLLHGGLVRFHLAGGCMLPVAVAPWLPLFGPKRVFDAGMTVMRRARFPFPGGELSCAALLVFRRDVIELAYLTSGPAKQFGDPLWLIAQVRLLAQNTGRRAIICDSSAPVLVRQATRRARWSRTVASSCALVWDIVALSFICAPLGQSDTPMAMARLALLGTLLCATVVGVVRGDPADALLNLTGLRRLTIPASFFPGD